jgi:hypothetical protein
LAEARQLPIEHPKDFDPLSGDTSWAAMAGVMLPIALFRDLGGFDSETFFMYCDDVDLSWRMRLAGRRIVYRPEAFVFHDKRLTPEGGWMPGEPERYYSAEAALLLPYKFSRPDLTEQHLHQFRASGDPNLLKAAAAYQSRVETGRLPQPIDPDHRIAEFVDGNYGRMRYRPS